MIYVNILGIQTYLLVFKLSTLLYYLVNISKSFSTYLGHLAHIVEFPIQVWTGDQEFFSYTTSKLMRPKEFCTIFNGKKIDTCPHMLFTNNYNCTSTHHVLQRFNNINKLSYTHEYTNYYFQKIRYNIVCTSFKCIQVQYVNLSPCKMQLQTLKMHQSLKVGDDHLTFYPRQITKNII